MLLGAYSALERQVMLPLLLKYRLQVEADPGGQTAEDKEFLMSTQDALALWEQKVRKRERRRAIKEGIKEGIEQGIAPARRLLLALYEMRFGPVPSAVRARVEATSDPKVMMAWSELVATASRKEVDGALGAS